MQYRKSQQGITLTELVLSIAIFSLLLGFIGINILRSSQHVSVSSTVDELTTDLKSQQIKAISGATDGQGVASSYGIYFGQSNYTLFRGVSYSTSDPSNFAVTTGTGITLSTTFPANTVVFSLSSGEIAGFTAGQNTITIKNSDGSVQKTLTLNKYGILTSIQ